MSDRKKYNGNGKDHGPEPQENEGVISFPSLAERDRIRLEKQAQEKKAAKAAHGPIINLPTMTKFLVLGLLAVHLATAVLMDPVRQYWVLTHLGFLPARYTGGLPLDWSAFISPLSYALLHGSTIHLLMNTLMLTALGAGMERWMGGRKMLVLFTLCSLFSALVHFAFNPFSEAPVVGASGGVSGLFAGALIMLRTRGAFPTGRYGLRPLVILWVAISALFGMTGGPDGSSIAWAAHIGGFLAGFVLYKPVLNWGNKRKS